MPAHPQVARVLSALLALFSARCERDRSAPQLDGATSAPAPGMSSSSPGAVGPRMKVTAEATAMGTRLNFVALTTARSDESHTRAAIERAIAEIRRLESLMTTWQGDSEVSRSNESAGRAPVGVGPETLTVIDRSLWISEKSGGVFDITF